MAPRFRPRARPSEFYYLYGYLFVLTVILTIGFGLARLEWWYFACSFASFALGVGQLALLGWWRKRYDSLHPEEADIDITRLERFSDKVSLRLVGAIARFVSSR